MQLILVLAAVALGACAGEWGIRLESPPETLGWLSQTWELGSFTTAVRADLRLLPFSFQRMVLSLSGSWLGNPWKVEGTWLSSGRLDAFLSASASHGFSVGLGRFQLAAGGKWGWAAINLSPLWLGTFWALAQLEGPQLNAKIQWEGPPSVWTVRIERAGLVFSWGRALTLEFRETQDEWTLSAQVQLAPRPEQRLSVAWDSAQRNLRAWLTLDGGGVLMAENLGGWNVLFSLYWGKEVRGALELTRAF